MQRNPTMKTATFPSVRVDATLRDAAEGALREGETLTGLIESAVREAIQRRQAEAEFVARGLAAIVRTQKAGTGIPADTVIAKLEARLATARQTLTDRKATQQTADHG